jgi:hypothetical protein
MKYSKLRTTMALLFATLTLFALATAVSADEFNVKEYGEFHDVLHPLQHEALPAKDFKRIRANAGELVKRGQAMVRVGVPKGTAEKQVEEFRRELRKFKDALGKFRRDSTKGTDQQLEVSFGAMHDSFEMLAGMLPRK